MYFLSHLFPQNFYIFFILKNNNNLDSAIPKRSVPTNLTYVLSLHFCLWIIASNNLQPGLKTMFSIWATCIKQAVVQGTRPSLNCSTRSSTSTCSSSAKTHRQIGQSRQSAVNFSLRVALQMRLVHLLLSSTRCNRLHQRERNSLTEIPPTTPTPPKKIQKANTRGSALMLLFVLFRSQMMPLHKNKHHSGGTRAAVSLSRRFLILPSPRECKCVREWVFVCASLSS